LWYLEEQIEFGETGGRRIEFRPSISAVTHAT
jgi:hypothetical protein